MDAGVKKLWIEALKSGEFQQGRHDLKSGSRYCCLGVLCELHLRETGQGVWRGGFYEPDEGPGNAYTLPPEVMNWARLDSSNPEVGMLGPHNSLRLSTLNDSMGHDFSQIAKVIADKL